MDLLLNYVWWDKDKRPNWEGARSYIENLTEREIQEHPEWEFACMTAENEKEALQELKDRLLDCHDAIRSVADGNDSRSCYVVHIGKYDVLITGGDSWGDSPTEMFDMIQDWGNLDKLPNFGFFPDWKSS